MPNSPTIVSAALSDKELQASINQMVANFDKGLQTMLEHSNEYVGKIQESLQKIGNTNFGAKGSNDGGVVKQTKAQNDFTDAVKKSTEEIKRQGKEAATSFDNFSKAQQVAIRSASPSGIRNADTLQTMNIQLDLLRERLREARQQYSSFVALAAHATTTGDKGLFQYATDGVHRYEQEVRNLIPQIRMLQSGIQQMGDVIAPQGHTIQNYVNSLQKANPELAALNAQYKSGTSLLQTQSTSYASATQSAQHYTEEVRKQAQAQQQSTQAAKEYSEQVKQIAAEIRQSAQWQKEDKFGFRRGMVSLEGRSYPVSENLSMGLRLEDQIVSVLQRANEERQKGVQTTQQQAQASQRLSEEDRKAAEQLGWIEEKRAKKRYISPSVEEVSQIRAALQSVTGQQEKWVDDIDKTKASYNQLSQYLKELKTIHADIWRDPKNANAAKVIAQEIQTVQREMQKWQQTMSRPVSLKDALSGSEKTLDDIAYKMQRLRAYKQGIDLTKPNATNEIKQVDEALAKLQKDADKWMSKSNEMIKSNTALGRSWNYMKNRLAFYFTVGASTQFVKNLIEVRSQYEMNERALGILIDSAERGTRIFNELSQMALVSPYTLIELSSAAKQLTAYDVAAKDVVDTTRRLADMAAAVGIPIERLTYALGQIKAYGYLNARDARMFSNAGIPLVKQLAEHYTELEGKMVSTADVYDRIKKKAIDMTDVMQVINKMTDEGGKFFDFQAKMAGTLKVQLANLTLAWNNMLNDIGASEQGTISTGIGLLKELFLEWKNISKMVTNLAIGFGIVKAAQLAYYGVVMGTNKAIALETVLGNRLSNNLRSLASSTNAARMSSTALWVGLATFAAAAVVDILRGNEAMKEFNKTLRENAENTYNDLKKFSENYSSLRESLYKTENGKQTPVDINSEEAKKAWEVLREQIELSSHASDEYIGKLLSIENVSERLRQGFAMIESIQSVSAAIKELGDSSIKLERDWSEWWNFGLLPDGTIGNLQDAYMWLSKIEEKYGSVVNARKVASTSRTDEGLDNVFQDEAKEFVENYETELEKFRKDLQTTKQSIIDFIELKGWSGDTSKINEAFKTFTDNLILKNQLNPQQAYTLQLEMEEARSKAAKQAQYARIKDLERAYYIEKNKQHREELAKEYEKETEIYNNWDNFNGRKKVEWERFTKWLKEQHISETTAMFRNMDAEDIRSLNFQEGKHAEWVKRMVTQYAKEHKMSYDDAFGYLKSWVTSANQWSIFIPMTISTEDSKTVYKQLGEYDKAVDEADAQIERLTKRINELNAKKKKSKEETEELAKAEEELTRAQKDKADAEAKGGHGKKEKKDEKAADKTAKQAETELQKALKDELSTIDKVRSIYKDLTKEGMSHANAVERATRGWDETVNAINRVLQKNGLQKLDLSKFAGIENPRELVNMLQSQLNTLLKRGAKPAEIKELQTKIQTLNVDAEKYDLTKITKGLNNELGKLKDEYELAVELDANPELGDMFADMFGINTSTLPKTFGEALDRAQTIINRKLAEMNITTPFDLMEGNIDSFAKSTGLDKDGAVIKELVSAQNAYRDMFKKNITETEKMLDDYIKKYGDYSDKIAEIEAGRLKKLKKLNEAYYTKEMRKQPEYIAKLNAIEQGTNKEKQQVDFDEFKNSRYYTMMFENLDYISTKTIRDMRDRVREYIDTAKDLTPEQLKTLISQYEKLEQKVVKRSPFKTLTKDLKEYFSTSKERKAANNEFRNAEKEYNAQSKIVAALNKKYEQAKANNNTSQDYLDFLKIEIDSENEILKILKEQLEAAQKKADKYNLIKKLSLEEASQVAQLVSSNLQSLGELRDFLQQDLGIELSDELNGLVDGLSKVGQGINKITSSATSGDVVGVITGVGQTIYGLYDGIASIFGGGSAADKKITKQIQDSERAVKRLELAYIDLEHAIKNAYGMATIGAQKAAIANKELQLVELKRQLALEKSRDSKDRDEDRIAELQKQIKELEYDIKDATDAIVNDLLGISSVGDAMETMMDSFINALRNGEDAMSAFDESVNNMIANMIKKLYVTKILEPWFWSIWSSIEKKVNDRTKGFYEDLARYYSIDYWESVAEDGAYSQVKAWDGNGESMKEHFRGIWGDIVDQMDWGGTYQDFAKSLVSAYKSGGLTVDDIREFAELVKSDSPIIQEGFKEVNAILEELGLINSNKTLSALQQGLQGVSEETASAVEAYLNGMSQQAYLRNDLLVQIRDTIMSFDMDVQLGVFSQMLLQLQNNYIVMQSMQSMMENWTVPSGSGIRVELMS